MLGHNGDHFVENMFSLFSVYILIQISLAFIPKVSLDDKPLLVHIWLGAKPVIFEQMMTQFIADI